MADIVFITAPIGGGKTLFSVKLILDELAKGERMVVTNVPLHVGSAPDGQLSVAEWLGKYYPDRAVDLEKRLRLLTSVEVFDFYLHLPGRVEVPQVLQKRPKVYQFSRDGDDEMLPDLSWRQEQQASGVMPPGCLFVVDEVHLYFGAREWQKAGKSVESYMSQLRKMNDDLYLITQHPDKVDKNFRRNATEWLYVQNMSKTRLLMGVTLKDRFRVHSFPLQPLRNDKPERTITIQLMQQEIAKVYDTMAGAGVAGRLAPEKNKFTGKHWSVWLVMLILVLGVAICVPRLVMYGIGRSVGGMMHGLEKGASIGLKAKMTGQKSGSGVLSQTVGGAVSASQTVGEAVSASQTVGQSVPVSQFVGRVGNRVPPVVDDVQTNAGVYVTGITRTDEDTNVMLSDGQSYSVARHEVHAISRAWVYIDGVRYPVKRVVQTVQTGLYSGYGDEKNPALEGVGSHVIRVPGLHVPGHVRYSEQER